MKYQITSDNIEISESMKALAENKFAKIESRLTDKEKETALARIVLNRSGAEGEFRVKIVLSFVGKEYFSSEKDFLLESALIKAVKGLERQRKKDDLSFEGDWEKNREIKRSSVDNIE